MRNWESYVRKVVPYVPGEQPNEQGMIKLNTNENPYPPSPEVARILQSSDADRLRLYPDPNCGMLVDAIADYYGKSSSEVFVGVGSDDVLAMIFLTFFCSGKPIFFPDITYSFYDVWADMLRIPYETKALDEHFLIRSEDYLGENGGIVFPNPNAPTGILTGLAEIESIVAKNRDVVVVVDEAYIDFGGESALPLTEKYDNLLVVQTFSKSRSMAGMRLGYAMGNAKLIGYLNDVKYSFNSYTMSRLALELGTAAIKDQEYFDQTRQKIMETREWTKERLRELGFSFGDSKSNFIFATHERIPAEEIFEALRKKKIYVRHFSKERIRDYLRISIGTKEEMETLIEFLRGYLL
ncbi:MAG: histidinol-phosphate transaminase [Roseburia sp.]